MIKVFCSFCKKKFERHPSKIISDYVYCSRECGWKAKTVNLFFCQVCSKVFRRSIHKGKTLPRFCSPAHMYQQLKIERNPLNCTCLHCGKQFHKSNYAIRNGEGKYCSWNCKKMGSRGARSDLSHYYGLTNWREIRVKVLERDSYTCVKCGAKEVKLHVNHIQFRQLGGTDDLTNLETLCMPCHAKTDAELLKKLTGNEKARMKDYKNFFTK